MPAANTPASAKPNAVASGSSLPAGFGLLIFAALVIICAGLRTVSAIVAPTFLVLTLVITVQPLRVMLTKRGLPRWLASTVVVLCVYALLVAVLGSAVWSLSRLVDELPTYTTQFTSFYNSALAELAKLGLDTSTLTKYASDFNLSSLGGVAQSLLNTVTSGLSLLTLLLIMVFFLTYDAAGIGERIALIRAARPHVADALLDFSNTVRRYWIVTTVFGLVVAVINVIGLYAIGVPLAVTWGVLAFVTNYIPNVGFILGLVPPTIIALLDGGVGPAIGVLVLYCASNLVIQTLIQPRFTGDAVGITATVAFLSLIFWSFLLGALGALLAIPATLLVKALLVDHSTSASWLGALLDSAPKPRPNSRPSRRGRVASAK